MTYRLNTLVSIVAVISVLMITSCDVFDSGGEEKHQLNLHVNTTEPVLESSDGSNTIEISRVKMSLGDIGFITQDVEFREDTVIVHTDTVSFEDKFPRVVSFAPGNAGTKVHLGTLDPTLHQIAYFDIHPPRGDVSDSDLGSETSLLIEGTYNNSSFTYRSGIDTSGTTIIRPSLEMTEHTAELDLDFLIKTESLFKGSSGNLLDPTTDAAKSKITERLINAFAFEEGNRTLREYEDMRQRDD